jgi:tetratricopeptide (TPR) repeat protein
MSGRCLQARWRPSGFFNTVIAQPRTVPRPSHVGLHSSLAAGAGRFGLNKRRQTAARGSNVRFCPHCGSPVLGAARFCVECGVRLDALVSPPIVSAPTAPAASGVGEQAPVQLRSAALAPFAATFGAIVAVGVLVAYGVMRQIPQREALLSSASQQAAQGSPAVAVEDTRQLPPGHPAIQLPKEARDLISIIGRKAEANPRDVAAWDRYADVCFRAAAFDSSYYTKSASAYAHVLKLAPDDLEALRGIGNIDFDQHKYDEAIAAYEHYLSEKPEDAEVRTDLGTMLLSSGSADQAVLQYRKVLETHPDFFEASFNLGIAYGEMNELEAARAAFEKARALAPDTNAKNRVMEMLAELGSATIPASQEVSKPAEAASAVAAESSGFKGAIERMLRDLPIAGPKVTSVQWPSSTRARVLMDNFPMDQMPPFATAKFMSDLKTGIGDVKSAHDVSAPVEIDICDAASGRVMQSVTQ